VRVTARDPEVSVEPDLRAELLAQLERRLLRQLDGERVGAEPLLRRAVPHDHAAQPALALGAHQ